MLRCRNGHPWEARPGEFACPVCGAPPEAPSGQAVSKAPAARPRPLAPDEDYRPPSRLARRTLSPVTLLAVVFAAVFLPLSALALMAGFLLWRASPAGGPIVVVPQPIVGDDPGPQPLAVFSVAPWGVRGLAFVEGGASLAVGAGGRDPADQNAGKFQGAVKLWDVKAGRPGAPLGEDHGPVDSLAVSADGTTLAWSAEDGTVQVWDLAAGKARPSPPGKKCSGALSLSPDGSLVAFAEGGGNEGVKLLPAVIVLYDLAAAAERARMPGHGGTVHSLTFSADGAMLASASEDHTVRLWDAKTGKERANLKGHRTCVYCVALSPDGLMAASGDNDGELVLWDVANKRQLANLLTRGAVSSVAFTPDGKRLLAGMGVAAAFGEVWVYDMAGRKPTDILKGPPDVVTRLALSPDGGTVAAVAQGDHNVWLWAMPPAKP